MIDLAKGYIGQFTMESEAHGREQLQKYLGELQVAGIGHKKIIAPINGSTWHSYRLVSESDERIAPFPGEPSNLLWYNTVYESVGFKPLQSYYSEIFEIPTDVAPANTIDIRAFSASDFETIYRIACVAFADNFLYSPITYEAFAELYRGALSSATGSEYIALAYEGNTAVGFIFSFVFDGRLILKTMGVLPAYRSQGIGRALITHVCQIAKKNGIDTAIGALIATGNHSGKIVASHGGRVFRTYTLYEYQAKN